MKHGIFKRNLTRWAVPMFLAAGIVQAETTLKWVGCGITKKAFMTELATAYEAKTGVKIDIQGGGATRGIRETIAMGSDADMGGTCRFMLHSEQSGQAIKAEPVAWDALVVITHKSNTVSDISSENLRAVYRGEITNWKQLGGPDRPLRLFIRKGKISGVGRTLRKLVLNDFEADITSEYVFKSSGPLEKAVQQDQDAIAITGISSAKRRDVKVLSLNGKFPSYENIKSGDFVLYRPLYIVVNYLKPQSDAAEQFVSFALSHEGRQIIRKNGTVPYRDGYNLIQKMLRQNRKSFRDRKS